MGARRPAGLPTPRPPTSNSQGIRLYMFLRTTKARIHARLKECVFRRRIFAMLLLKFSVKAALWPSLARSADSRGPSTGRCATSPIRLQAGPQRPVLRQSPSRDSQAARPQSRTKTRLGIRRCWRPAPAPAYPKETREWDVDPCNCTNQSKSEFRGSRSHRWT